MRLNGPVPPVESISKRLRVLLRSSISIAAIDVTGDRELVLTCAPRSYPEALKAVEAACGVMRAQFTWSRTLKESDKLTIKIK